MRIAVVFLGALLSVASAPAESSRPELPGIDWAKKVVRTKGVGAPDLRAPSIAVARMGAEKAAEMDALRNILATLKGVQLSSEQTVGQRLDADAPLRGRVEGLVCHFKRTDTRYFSDGGVEVDVEMSLDGELAQALLGGAEKESASSPEDAAKSTGLVVDARGLKAVPALSPRLLDEQGQELYSVRIVRKDAVKSHGIAAYSRDLDEARRSPRVGEKPLVLKAQKLEGKSDLVLSKEDAASLRSPEGSPRILAEGRVVIVVD